MTSLHSYKTLLNQDIRHSSLSTATLCSMAQSPLVTVHIPLPIYGPVGEGLEHGTMDVKVAGSVPGQGRCQMVKCNVFGLFYVIVLITYTGNIH